MASESQLLVATLVACRHNDAVSSPAQDTVAAVTQDKLLVTTLAGDIMTQFQVLLRTLLQLIVQPSPAAVVRNLHTIS